MSHFTFSKSLFTAATAVAAISMLVACGGNKSTSPKTKVAGEDAVAPVTASTVAALYETPMSFSTGIPVLGTTTATTLAFSPNPEDASKPVFSIKTETDSASGDVTFGSCHFIIKAKTPGITTVAVGDTVVVDPCEIKLNTNGKAVGTKDPVSVGATLQLGTTLTSQTATIHVAIKVNGEVNIVLEGGGMIKVAEVPVKTVPVTGSGK